MVYNRFRRKEQIVYCNVLPRLPVAAVAAVSTVMVVARSRAPGCAAGCTVEWWDRRERES